MTEASSHSAAAPDWWLIRCQHCQTILKIEQTDLKTQSGFVCSHCMGLSRIPANRDDLIPLLRHNPSAHKRSTKTADTATDINSDTTLADQSHTTIKASQTENPSTTNKATTQAPSLTAEQDTTAAEPANTDFTNTDPSTQSAETIHIQPWYKQSWIYGSCAVIALALGFITYVITTDNKNTNQTISATELKNFPVYDELEGADQSYTTPTAPSSPSAEVASTEPIGRVEAADSATETEVQQHIDLIKRFIQDPAAALDQGIVYTSHASPQLIEQLDSASFFPSEYSRYNDNLRKRTAPVPHSSLYCETADFTRHRYVFIEHQGSTKIHLGTSFALGEHSWEQLAQLQPGTSTTQRVVIHPDTFFNYEYRNFNKYRCWLLTNPNGTDPWYGYTERGSSVDTALINHFQSIANLRANVYEIEGNINELELPVIIQLRVSDQDPSKRVATITQLIHTNWFGSEINQSSAPDRTGSSDSP